jgi:branched-chain amino acid transport system substrate-binding protein
MTQRKANPWFVRADRPTSAQCAYPMADYCAKHLKWKSMAAIRGRFRLRPRDAWRLQQVFEDRAAE